MNRCSAQLLKIYSLVATIWSLLDINTDPVVLFDVNDLAIVILPCGKEFYATDWPDP